MREVELRRWDIQVTEVRGGPPVDVTVENHASETDADLMAPVGCVVGIIIECLVL